MEIFSVLTAIAAWCGANSYNMPKHEINQCKREIVLCINPKEGDKIKFDKMVACFIKGDK